MTTKQLPATDFCLIRHGETTANAQAIIAGVTDVPLTSLGQQQAQALTDRPWPEKLNIVASPMMRAQQTARLIFPQQALQSHDGIRERNWGVFEGQPLSELPKREDTPPHGESWSAMLMRVERAIIEICSVSHASLPVLVCHSGVIRAARVLWTTGDVGLRPPNATPLLFQRAGNKFSENPLWK